jgi:hypothetical protein
VFAVTYRWAVLSSSGSLCGHLQLANLSFGQPSIAVAVWTLLRLGLLLGLLLELWRLWLGMAQTRGFTMWSVQIDAGGGRWDLALSLEQTRLQVDDVVAQLVVLGLERLVQFAKLLELLDLILELFNVLFFALTEGALGRSA